MPQMNGMSRTQAFVLGFGLAMILLGIVANIFDLPRPAPVVQPAPEVQRMADTTAQFYRLGDSVAIRMMTIPHGKGVIIEIQPVKFRKLPPTGSKEEK